MICALDGQIGLAQLVLLQEGRSAFRPTRFGGFFG